MVQKDVPRDLVDGKGGGLIPQYSPVRTSHRTTEKELDMKDEEKIA